MSYTDNANQRFMPTTKLNNDKSKPQAAEKSF